MLGFYNYTVWLTYLSVGVSVAGIIGGLSGRGHPWISAVCLIVCAILDGFDGRVARTKKDRTNEEKQYGIELDSLADVIAFGVLPCAVCAAAGRAMADPLPKPMWAVFYAASALFVVAGVIRLANFNSVASTGPKRHFTGVPITTSALVFPQVVALQFIVPDHVNLLPLSVFLMLVLGLLFLLKKVHIRKPSLSAVIILTALGCAEIVLLTVLFFSRLRHA